MIEEKYFFKTVLDLPYEEAKRKVTEALSGEGFGILTEIDVKATRSEEHTSELQSHSFISYAVFCLKKKKQKK